MNVADHILSNGRAAALAVLGPDGQLTYAELRSRVSQISGILLARGYKKGERVGLLSENSLFFVAAYLGVIRAGLVVVPLQTDLGIEALGKIAADAGMTAVLVSKRLFGRVRGWLESTRIDVLLETDINEFAAAGSASMLEISPENDLAALMFTSGSTGTPKGVMISHRNIECNTRDIISYLTLVPADRVMVVLPFHYCFGLSLLHTHLTAGASLVLNNSFKLFPEQLLIELQEKECTGLAGVPSTYQILLRKTRFCQSSFPKLRYFQQAGGKLPNSCIREILDAFPHVRFFLMYGQTEGTARLSYLPPEQLVDKLGSIGRGLPSTRLEVLKPDGTPVAPGSDQIGEIVACGDNIALGYWKDPVETAAYFKSGRLHTGDLGRVDEDGFIFFVERERDLLKPGGNRVSAREIEEVIAELREVVEVAVVGAPHELLGEIIHAFVVPGPRAVVSSEEIKAHCRKRLPAFKVPHEISFLESLPHNAAGKVLKPKLREMARATRRVPNSGTADSKEPVPASLLQLR